MLLPPSLLKLVKLVERVKAGLTIDEVWIDGLKAKNATGTFQLKNKDALTMECQYTDTEGSKHVLKAVDHDGAANNELTLDGVSQTLVSIKLKSDFDATLGGVTVELEAILKYKDASGETHSLKLSSEQVDLV